MQLLGALGLFLLGMWLMTEGLKIAGGKALEHMLGKWISSRWRGFVAGVVVTGLVQSSSAVTVATIGFVNAGLMSFAQSVWVIFGSNVGTTLTAWLVTLIGFKLDMAAFTYPLIGIGALLKVFSPKVRGQSLGMALAGFGLLFMGISALQSSFSAVQFDPASLTQWINSPLLVGLGLGVILTILTQSSSAAIAIILTASASGMGDWELAAAAVIGANIGTTSTALLASLGASAGAKRLVMAHVLFNLLTGLVALCLLPLLTWGLADWLGTASHMPLFLALFHSGFNLLGVLLMLPVEPKMSAWLLSRFRRVNRYTQLDTNLAAIPDLALGAVQRETALLRLAILELPQAQQTDVKLDRLQGRVGEIREFISKASRNPLTEQQGQAFEQAMADLHGFSSALEAYLDFIAQADALTATPFAQDVQDWLAQVQHFADLQRQMSEGLDTPWQALNQRYKQLRHRLIRISMSQHLDAAILEKALQGLSACLRCQRRILESGQHPPILAS
ncbi:hypothetical protein GCM10009092_07190 [Bowmanella denitrificans]|uniref:Phosphate:Na+ symporter n=1 Tax=Bowmanella denitrificans TaxID=366582 RepID=A0ABP3GJ29_9ALTE